MTGFQICESSQTVGVSFSCQISENTTTTATSPESSRESQIHSSETMVSVVFGFVVSPITVDESHGEEDIDEEDDWENDWGNKDAKDKLNWQCDYQKLVQEDEKKLGSFPKSPVEEHLRPVNQPQLPCPRLGMITYVSRDGHEGTARQTSDGKILFEGKSFNGVRDWLHESFKVWVGSDSDV